MAGRKYDSIVHFVSESLVDKIGDSRVVVWWPNCSKGKWWEGQLIGRSINVSYFKTSLHGRIILYVLSTSLPYILYQRNCAILGIYSFASAPALQLPRNIPPQQFLWS